MRDRPKIEINETWHSNHSILQDWAKDAATEIEVLKLLITKREQLQLKYIELLREELDSAVGVAHIHGWRSQNVEKGKELREKLELEEWKDLK